jgi:hypothetical protein
MVLTYTNCKNTYLRADCKIYSILLTLGWLWYLFSSPYRPALSETGYYSLYPKFPILTYLSLKSGISDKEVKDKVRLLKETVLRQDACIQALEGGGQAPQDAWGTYDGDRRRKSILKGF